MASNLSFEDAIGHVWHRLTSNTFTKPFQLAKHPRQQDLWTTWLEHLKPITKANSGLISIVRFTIHKAWIGGWEIISLRTSMAESARGR